MEWVRSGYLMSSVLELRQDLLTVIPTHWEYTTVIIMKMLVWCVKCVLKEPFDSKEVMPLEDVWRSATTTSGAQCVMTSGVLKKLKLFAETLDMKQQVRLHSYLSSSIIWFMGLCNNNYVKYCRGGSRIWKWGPLFHTFATNHAHFD